MMTALSKPYRIVNVEQRSPEWYKFRQWKIGGSYAPIIMGESPYETSQGLYQRIVDGIEIEMNADIQRGISLENEALDLINASYGENYKPACFENKNAPFLIASVDGWNGTSGLEIKCPRKFSKEIFSSQCPRKYYAQCQHCMFVCDTDHWLYCEYIFGGFMPAIVNRDDEYIARLIEKECEFHNCLMNFVKPKTEFDDQWEKLNG